MLFGIIFVPNAFSINENWCLAKLSLMVFVLSAFAVSRYNNSAIKEITFFIRMSLINKMLK